jgi:hypothetical protein
LDEQDEVDNHEEDEEEGCTCGETCWKCVPSTSTASQAGTATESLATESTERIKIFDSDSVIEI